MSLNPDRSKKAQEVFFSRELKSKICLSLVFSNSDVYKVNSQKYLGFILDFELIFNKHLDSVLNETDKTIILSGLFRRFLTHVFSNAANKNRYCTASHTITVLGVRCCAMPIFLFLRFDNFIKVILHIIHNIFKKFKIIVLYLTY